MSPLQMFGSTNTQDPSRQPSTREDTTYIAHFSCSGSEAKPSHRNHVATLNDLHALTWVIVTIRPDRYIPFLPSPDCASQTATTA